jgi:hypothetical protein
VFLGVTPKSCGSRSAYFLAAIVKAPPFSAAGAGLGPAAMLGSLPPGGASGGLLGKLRRAGLNAHNLRPGSEDAVVMRFHSTGTPRRSLALND